MKFKSKNVIKMVNYIMDASAKRVSLVRNGANQTPATIFKAEDFDNVPEELLKELEMEFLSEDVEVLAVHFPKEFTDKEVANYLATKFEGKFDIEEGEEGTIAKSNTTVERSDTRELILTNNIKFILTKGEIVDTIKSDEDKRINLMKDKETNKEQDKVEAPKVEKTDEQDKKAVEVQLTEKEAEALAKFDGFSAAISEASDIKQVLREANDGFIPGYNEIAFASSVAIRNATLKGETDKIVEISTTTGLLMAAVAELMKSEQDEANKEVEKAAAEKAAAVEKTNESNLDTKLIELTKSLSEQNAKLVTDVTEKFSLELKAVAERLDALEVTDSGSRSDVQNDRHNDTAALFDEDEPKFEGIGLVSGVINGRKR